MRFGLLLVLTSALLAACSGKPLPADSGQAPDTEITSGPAALSNQATARFTFVSTIDGSHFLCVLDSGDAQACASPWTTTPGDGAHHLVVTAVAPSGLPDPTPATFDWTIDTVPKFHLRIMSANLTSGNDQSYDPGDGARILEGLKPDVVMIQEFHYYGADGQDSDQDVRSFVDQTFGPGFSFYREPQTAAINLPNGVISRYPILDGGEWTDESPTGTTPFNRSFVWAEIDLPGPRNLWAVSLHLKSGSTDEAQRDTEAQEIVSDVEANVPAGDYLVIGGDFNTYSRDPAQEPALGELANIVVTPGATRTDFPVDQAGDGGTSAARNHPYDWVLAGPALNPLQVDTTFPSGNDFPDGLVFDSRVYTPLSDVPPVQVGDSAAVNMQHMGVVKDFELPAQ